jgi:molybdenum cofactor biosynthesis protein B
MKKNNKRHTMKSETSTEHQKEASADISCGIITLSDSRKSEKLDLSGKYIAGEIESRYTLKSRSLIPDEKDDLINSIETMIEDETDVIITNGGTGLAPRDITVETVESLFEKKLDGFGEIFRAVSYEEIGSAALLSRATAGIYKKTLIISMPGSPNAVKTALRIIIDELPHIVHHVKK